MMGTNDIFSSLKFFLQLFCNPRKRRWAFAGCFLGMVVSITVTGCALGASTPLLLAGANMIIAAHVFSMAQFLAALLPSSDADIPLLDAARVTSKRDPVLDA